jgi:hypothetical protein
METFAVQAPTLTVRRRNSPHPATALYGSAMGTLTLNLEHSTASPQEQHNKNVSPEHIQKQISES